MRLSDDQRAILAELNADARYTEEALAELADECDTFNEMLCEIADADLYDPCEPAAGRGVYPDADGEEIPF